MVNFDAIVMGAGNTGLTAAATAARRSKTLLLERYNIPEECATSLLLRIEATAN
jgi:prolycopene isomerase